MYMVVNVKKGKSLETEWKVLQSGIFQHGHEMRTSGSMSSGHCCSVCHIVAHRLHLIRRCGRLSSCHCGGKKTHFNHQKHKSDKALQRWLHTLNFTGRPKGPVVYPSDVLKQCCDVFLAQARLENVWPCRGERPADALRVCHSESPVSGAVRHSYKEVALTKPLATTELDCCESLRDSGAVVCLLTQHLPISAGAIQNLHFIG